MLQRLFVCALLSTVCASAFAATETPIVPSQKVLEQATEHNSALSERGERKAPTYQVDRPFADYEKVKYLIFSSDTPFDSKEVKITILRNLPEDVTVMIYVGSSSEIATAKKTYGKYIDESRLRVVALPGAGQGFWSRDGIPVPVYLQNNRGPALVDAKYYHRFEPDAKVASLFGSPLIKHDYYYEGGNFQADSRGNCLLVNNERAVLMPDEIFKDLYGCHTVNRFDHIAGIGHVDEVIRLLSDTEALTDRREYVGQLERLGYKVTLIPKAKRPFETYINSLVVNGTVFVPIMNESNDAKVIELYKQSGMKIVPIPVRSLPNDGKGSIHCITMTYPEMEQDPK